MKGPTVKRLLALAALALLTVTAAAQWSLGPFGTQALCAAAAASMPAATYQCMTSVSTPVVVKPPIVVPPIVVPPASAITPQAYQTAAKTNASQPANQIQVMGAYPLLNTIPESGITGSGSVNGTNIRFGKVADPTGKLDPATGKVRQVYQHAMAVGDPTTACCYRTDVALANGGVPKNTPYWVAMELYVPASTVSANEGQTIAAIHEGPDDGSGNWELQINRGTWQIAQTVEGQHSTWTTINPQPAANVWHKVVVQFTLSLTNGVTNVWVDGVQVMAFKGQNTVAAGGDYAKFGLYAYQMTAGSRYDLWRSYYLVKDAGYTLAQITALLQ